MFDRILVGNRGDVAVRIIRTCRDLGIETVAVYSTADREALHVRLADKSVHIGPAPALESYLSIPALIAAAETTDCQAIHPGWGFLAENAEFASACEDLAISFVGPRAETIALMGDKVRARELIRAKGVPVVPGSAGPVSPQDAKALSRELGFPLLLKASAGGGGRGMRRVNTEEELEEGFHAAAQESMAAFSDETLYIERALEDPRHVEIQVLGDGKGAILTLGERDCSVQRRHQKLIEESPSPAVSAALRAEMEGAARAACASILYRGAGTVEFLLHEGKFHFIEMNTRLQVEHPVTELLTGVDLVREQLRIAAGDGLIETGRRELQGHAVEVRINAEDPTRGFLPTPGILGRFRPPLGPGIRVDTHGYEGYEIPAHYDSLLAKVVAWASDRATAIGRSLRALSEFEIEGVATTRELAMEILTDDDFRSGSYTTGFLRDAGHRLRCLQNGSS